MSDGAEEVRQPPPVRKAWWKDLPKAEFRKITDLCGHCGHTRDLHLSPTSSRSERFGPCIAPAYCECQVGRDWRQAVDVGGRR